MALATVTRFLPTRLEICSWLRPKMLASWSYARASSTGSRSSRWTFSMRASSRRSTSVAAVVERWRAVHGEDDPGLRFLLQQLREDAQRQELERMDQLLRERGDQPEER